MARIGYYLTPERTTGQIPVPGGKARDLIWDDRAGMALLIYEEQGPDETGAYPASDIFMVGRAGDQYDGIRWRYVACTLTSPEYGSAFLILLVQR